MKRGLLITLCTAAVLSGAGAASAAVGSVADLRGAVSSVITAELQHDGASACDKLYAPLTRTVDGRTCAQRWDARSSRLLDSTGGAARLHADLQALPSAKITFDGLHATVALPHPLLGGETRFYWTDDCWMLMG